MINTVQRRTRDAFLLVLLIPGILGLVTLGLERKNSEDLSWVVHSQDVLRSVNRLMATAYQAESNQRGFLLTSDTSFLDNYRRYSAEEGTEVSRFARLTIDNPVQQEHAARLKDLWSQRALRIDRVLALRKEKAVEPGVAQLLREGRALMDQMTGVASETTAEEVRLLKLRTKAQRRTETALAWFFGAAIVVNVLLLYWAYRLVRDYGIARDVAQAELMHANAELEERVNLRTSELQAVNDSLSRSNEDLTRFAYVASHDLQEPLRTVGSYAGLLARRYQGKLDSQADKYIDFIVSGAKRMQNMVQDLLMYARTGTQQLTYARVDLNSVLAAVEQNLRILIAEAHARVERSELPVLNADESKLTMVLQNLVSNALKFRHPERVPLVRVSSSVVGDEWVTRVSDNGIGFDPEYAERIFVIFQRLHQVGEYAGTGIGLAICRRIVDGHGGRIWAHSVPGEGSVFSFSIPVHPARATKSLAEPDEVQVKKG